jgi:starvation-inducible DNA-binding protein
MTSQSVPNIGIPLESRNEVAGLLNALLADEYLLYTKTRRCHWDVVGPQFSELHKFFEAQYGQLDQSIDDIAERVRSLGAKAAGTLADFLKLTSLSEQSAEYRDARHMLATLLADHETVIRNLRTGVTVCSEEHHDAGTSDFLTGLMEAHEKMAWMLRAYLE